ncbi:hypothetical protein KQI63_14740 [bacterium]|nr:hypothetical protein [bacterium]
MDDSKRQDLEKLREQIDPEVLARVASAMGEDPSAASALSGNTAASPRRSSARLSNLKARMQAKEKIEPAKGEPEEPIYPASFIVYDPSFFRAKQLGAFIQKMGFPNVVITSEPEQFMRSVILHLNDSAVEKTNLAVYEDIYPGMKALLESDGLQHVRQILPAFDEMATFVMFETEKTPEAIEGLDPKYSLSVRLTPEFLGKRIRRLLDLDD